MKVNVNNNDLELITGDITKQTTEAIVNAANGSLLGGGGVDGAIHQAAGEELLEECKQIRSSELNDDYLSVGQAVITKGYQLPVKYVIHTVGPIWGSHHNKEGQLLANCYKNSLQLAHQYDLRSISFPSISTGVYHFPVDQAANIAMETIINFLENQSFGKVIMTLFSEADYNAYKHALNNLRKVE
ncbi:O-acetyl-ADP-ribose deacetylase [Virgibacillus sp. MSJ-26]|uniref:O-acetyl-ADP-ribose deacetylase n=1 Tax=Virgibacillus sp. MSJ-26 TaxID=2841522 RepID=UPI001C10AA9D|nr:O-acetyl-ADP-ribose deacetylase [Virgibacillus sp. MSJ-26]MBU5466109.1 O-acetyl-ADP-ribose deacetylase [Virgibacillus sp. MSJ-26]